MTTKTNNGNRFWPAFRAGASLYGLMFGSTLYAAPNYFWGPNGLQPTIWKKTCLESNDLDPITINYERFLGASILTLVLSHFLFLRRRDHLAMASFTRMCIACHLACFVVFAKVVLDDSGSFQQVPHVLYAATSLVLASMLFVSLRSIPSKICALAKPSRIQGAANIITAFYAGMFCVARIFGGASHAFFPRTPIEKNKFDVVMNTAAHMVGASLVPFAYGCAVEGWTSPAFVHKMACLYGVLTLPLAFLGAQNVSGYASQEVFAAFTIIHTLWTVFEFHVAGAFGTEKVLKRNVKTSKAA